MSKSRKEHDSLGIVEVPAAARWGAQTQRAIDNFRFNGGPMPAAFVRALARIKAAAALSNAELGELDTAQAEAIAAAAGTIAAGQHADQFPVDRYQTGSGTSSNMNMNEVIAHLVNDAGKGKNKVTVHPNDHVNRGQSSNDVVPAAIQLAGAEQLSQTLLPALEQLMTALEARAAELKDTVKTGRTHLMDAVPLRLDQELNTWRVLLDQARRQLRHALEALTELPLGGSAIGTGLNTHPRFATLTVARLAEDSGLPVHAAANPASLMSHPGPVLEASAALRQLAVALVKIANDLRWMNSGPIAGLGEIGLRALQPGSSIMPGKVNPVIPEAVVMACYQACGLDAAIALGAQSGNFQLNVCLPLLACNLLEQIHLLTGACNALAEQCIGDFEVNRDRLADQAARNPILATALAPHIGYELSARIAKQAQEQARSVLDVACELSDLKRKKLEQLLDPRKLTEGGIPG